MCVAVGWVLYLIFLFYGKLILPFFKSFTLIVFFGVVSLFLFYIMEEIIFQRPSFNSDFFLWLIFAVISPG